MSAALAGRVEEVAAGGDGRLFLSRGEGFDAQDLFAQHFTDDALLERTWRVPLERRLRMCREVGAQFVVLIAPEAHGVHAEALPVPLAYAAPSVGDRFCALARSMGITIVWPREAIRAARGAVDVWRRDDSHWSAHGAYIAYLELMAALPAHLSAGRVEADAFTFAWGEALGDLASTQAEAQRRPCLRPIFDAPRARLVIDRHNERRHGLRITEVDDPGLPSAVIFRDSAGTEMAPFLMESFRRCVLIGSAERGHVELIAEERPQVVVLERSERALLTGVIDLGLESWREAFPDPGDNPQATEATRAARAHLLAGDVAHALEEAERALALEPTMDRTLLAGRANLAAGCIPEAVTLLEAAVAWAPDRWTALIHAGCAQMAAGDLASARDRFARACALAPWRAEGFEHFGYASLHLGDAAGAVAPLRAAARLAPEGMGAHLWLYEALRRLGDGPGAAEALREGLRHHPANDLLKGHAASLAPLLAPEPTPPH